jgi:hypothetical protein
MCELIRLSLSDAGEQAVLGPTSPGSSLYLSVENALANSID